jgi:metallo-beta-lactamase family protein
MRLQFLGAAREVTGSQYYLQANGAKVLIDCGMFQEREFLNRNWEASPVRPRDIDVVLLTHAHIDHCGLLPKLVQEGFRGSVMTTSASADLVELVLRDSAQIQEEDVAFKKKRHRKEGRQGKYPEKPLYTMRDVDRALGLVRAVPYERPRQINAHLSAVFHDAGHILGSAMIELRAEDNGHSRRLIFSGDIGQIDKPLLRPPTGFAQTDYLVMESTYGNRNHENHRSIEDQLADVISQTVHAGGKVVIPIFAIERAQELVYYLGRLLRAKRIPSIPVFLDSPMAADVTDVFRRHRDCLAPQMKERLEAGDSLLGFSGLQTVRSVEQSMAINGMKHPSVIMATSGMCSAGRIKHHLAQYIGRPECTVLFVGYQASGTLGRQILDGNREVRIHGRSMLVRAKIATINGFSGHADHDALMAWLGHFTTAPRQVFVTHGEVQSSLALAEELRTSKGWNATVPEYKQVAELE